MQYYRHHDITQTSDSGGIQFYSVALNNGSYFEQTSLSEILVDNPSIFHNKNESVTQIREEN
jgi:hypothetical protein